VLRHSPFRVSWRVFTVRFLKQPPGFATFRHHSMRLFFLVLFDQHTFPPAERSIVVLPPLWPCSVKRAVALTARGKAPIPRPHFLHGMRCPISWHQDKTPPWFLTVSIPPPLSDLYGICDPAVPAIYAGGPFFFLWYVVFPSIVSFSG